MVTSAEVMSKTNTLTRVLEKNSIQDQAKKFLLRDIYNIRKSTLPPERRKTIYNQKLPAKYYKRERIESYSRSLHIFIKDLKSKDKESIDFLYVKTESKEYVVPESIQFISTSFLQGKIRQEEAINLANEIRLDYNEHFFGIRH
jgi:hypothetical protein